MKLHGLCTLILTVAVAHNVRAADVFDLQSGFGSSCVLLSEFELRCFGSNQVGQLGFLPTTENLGDEPFEMGNNLTHINLGTSAGIAKVVVKGFTVCVLFKNERMQCFGWNHRGQSGGVGSDPRLPGSFVNLLFDMSDIATHSQHTCGVFGTGRLSCFGANDFGQLGLGDLVDRTTGPPVEFGDTLASIDLGVGLEVDKVVAGAFFTCALLTNQKVKCFGRNELGVLGIGDNVNRGGNVSHMGDALPYVDFGDHLVKKIESGTHHLCAILDNDRLKCLGANDFAQLGLGFSSFGVGTDENELGNLLPFVDLGANVTVKDVSAGRSHTCALLNNDQIKCFGDNSDGQLGYGDTVPRVLSEQLGDNLPYVNVGDSLSVLQVRTGNAYTCVLLNTRDVKCFGRNDAGQLGKGDTANKGGAEFDMGDNLTAIDFGSIMIPTPSPTNAPSGSPTSRPTASPSVASVPAPLDTAAIIGGTVGAAGVAGLLAAAYFYMNIYKGASPPTTNELKP